LCYIATNFKVAAKDKLQKYNRYLM